jgi:alkylated DNA repair dioxygenase AlkB
VLGRAELGRSGDGDEFSLLAPSPRAHPSLEGHVVFEDFVSEEEEAAILQWLGRPGDGPTEQCEPAWRHRNSNGPAYGKRWGVLVDLRARTHALPQHAMPRALRPIVDRIRARATRLVGREWLATEANAIEYRREEGHYLAAHFDDRALSGRTICNLSLAADAVMTYTRAPALSRGSRVTARGAGRARSSSRAFSRAPAELPSSERVLLRRRSLQIQTGACRYSFQHGICNEVCRLPAAARALARRRKRARHRSARLADGRVGG